MTYRDNSLAVPITVVETDAFTRMAARIWTDDEVTDLIDHVASNPEVGVVMPGTGGVRKLRWGRGGHGKRGGARLIYFYYREACPLYLLLAYTKAQASDLTPDDKKAVAAFAVIIKRNADQGDGA